MTLTGITFVAEGDPEFLVQAMRERLREVAASLPAGQTQLKLTISIDHPKDKKRRRSR